jgi:hypothetical protein
MQTIAKTCVALAAALSVGAAFAEVKFDANIETNTTKVTGKSVDNGGRVEVNANAQLMKNGDNFVNAKGTLEIPLTGDKLNIADAWIQFGNSSADLKLGRFEAVDLFPLGKDVVVEGAGAASGYRANSLRGRFSDGQLHAAVGLNAGAGLRAELGVVTKKDTTGKAYGFRPTVTYSSGPLTLRAGVESIKTEGSTAAAQTGFGLSAGYAINSDTSVNVNYAKNSKANAQSFGANATFGAAGVGLIQDKNASAKQTTFYAAYSFPLFGIKGATVTPAISRSTGTGKDGVTAVRVRLNYAF